MLSTLALSVFLVSAAAPADTPLISVTGKTTFALCVAPDCKPEGRIQLTLREGLTGDDVSIGIETVSLNSVLDGSLRDAFKVEWLLNDVSKKPIAIVITAPRDRVLRQGSYDVIVAVAVTKTGERVTLTVTATRAAGLLTVPALLKFDRTVYVPFSSSGVDSPARLVATETSKNSSVVIKAPAPPTSSEDADQPGVLRLNGGTTINPGEQQPISYQTTGTFPLGSTTGTLVIPSDQLVSPLIAAYEVRTRLHPLYIPALVVVGLVVSWFVKVKLQEDVDRAAAEVRVQELLTHIAGVRSRHLDPSLESSVREQMVILADAVKTKTPAEIEAARKTLETDFQAALAALPGKRTPVEKTIEDLRAVTDAAWVVPTAILQRLQEASAALRPALTLLQSDGITQAKDAAEKVRATLMGQLSTLIDSWQAAIAKPLADLQKPMPGLSDQVVAAGTARLAAATSALTTIKFSDPTATPATLLPILRDLVRARFLALDALRGVGSAAQTEVLSATTTLRDLPLPLPDQLPALQATANNTAKFLEQLADVPDAWTADGPKVMQTLHDSWGQALVQQTPAQAAALQALHADRRYLEEVDLVASALPAVAPAGAGTALSLRRSFAPVAFSSEPPSVGSISSTVLLALPGAGRIPTATPRTFLTRKDLKNAKRLQSVIVGALLAIFGYATYEANFIGKLTEMINIFFWAFGLDLTVDALLKLVRKS